MGPMRPRLLLSATALFLTLLAPGASADLMGTLEQQWEQLPHTGLWEQLPPQRPFSVDPSDFVDYECQSMPCVGLVMQACGGVLTVGAQTDLLPGDGVYAELAEPGGGVGAYGGSSGYCGDRDMVYVGPGP
jgi:hypothetical protein